MKQLRQEDVEAVGGALDPRQYDTQVAPDATTTDPVVIIDYNPPQQPQ